MEAGDGPSFGSVAQPLALRTPGLHPRGRIIVLCVCVYSVCGLVLGDIEILHIDYCELNIADISIYWVVGWIGIQ